ncbi:ribonuclease M5 [Alkalihalobacillus pseudalcaliphilus]|uniref:ribonuclease M5 n=1 Tax=Alkalihalobacillus pseudalcaliphilus TaxID=79884 RepID=UPI00064E0442|nr:ribonuclease M5 [Alkalihalobacillus pseudalcaliphilus]KMK74475.1 ribonuclease M5 [Alkalihalobacillus pseudalcaliphilus]
MKVKEVIVVEGRDDTVAIKRAVDADTIETNGSAINESTLRQIELAQQRRGVIILTDPDYPGERIRKIIENRVNGCKHAFLTKKEALSKRGGNLGVENASPDSIRQALQDIREQYDAPEEMITRQDLLQAGLIAGPLARQRREKLGEKLKIGYANGKQLHRRLQTFHIQAQEFAEALSEVFKEEEGQ